MTENEKETKGVEPPLFDPNKFLLQLQDIVSKRTERNPITVTRTNKATSIWSYLIVAAIALAAIAIGSWLVWRKSKELARLRHEKNRAAIRREQLEFHAELDENNMAIDKAQKEIDAAENSLRIIEADIKAEESRYEADLRAIDSIRSWRDAGIR